MAYLFAVLALGLLASPSRPGATGSGRRPSAPPPSRPGWRPSPAGAFRASAQVSGCIAVERGLPRWRSSRRVPHGPAARGGQPRHRARLPRRPQRVRGLARRARHSRRRTPRARTCAPTRRASAPAALAPSSRARALSAVRALHRRLADTGVDGDRSGRRPARAAAARDGCRRWCASPTRSGCSTPRWGDEPLDLRDHALLELLYGCGLRAAEACALDRADVTPARGARAGQGRRRCASCPSAARRSRPWPRWLADGRPELADRDSGDARSCSRAAAAAWSRPPSGARSAAGCASSACRPPARTPCATPTPPTCWSTAATCGRSRSSSGIRSLSTTEVYTQVSVAHLRRAHAMAHPRG